MRSAAEITGNTWVSAFQRSQQATLRLLSLASQYGSVSSLTDVELEVQQSAASILASGLPLPKSPSLQQDEIRRGESSSTRRQEREERGWWSLRFQQVLRDLQRQDVDMA